MFESLEIKRVKNVFLVTVHSDDDAPEEYVFDAMRKALKFIKEFLEANAKGPAE